MMVLGFNGLGFEVQYRYTICVVISDYCFYVFYS